MKMKAFAELTPEQQIYLDVVKGVQDPLCFKALISGSLGAFRRNPLAVIFINILNVAVMAASLYLFLVADKAAKSDAGAGLGFGKFLAMAGLLFSYYGFCRANVILVRVNKFAVMDYVGAMTIWKTEPIYIFFVTAVGCLLFFLPGLYFVVLFSFAWNLMEDRQIPFKQALEISFQALKPHWWRALLLASICAGGLFVCAVLAPPAPVKGSIGVACEIIGIIAAPLILLSFGLIFGTAYDRLFHVPVVQESQP